MQFSSSNTVDSRVVELRFDNSQFESNAKTSLSTLDRLKKSLDFSKHKTTFVDIGNGLRSISIAPLAAGLDGVTAKFSNLEIMGKRALEALTDDIYRTSKAFLESVSIKQVEQGWGKYAEKTSAVQTIMAATAKDFNDTAEQMEYVNTQLDKLNWFTDETSYNFLEMVNSIGKFTSNNIELDKSVTAMEGISNWAAISGANAQMATHAMYNLSQAIATGSVKLMDWKSIENANMATAEFKQTAIETAEAMGTLKKVSDNEWETLDGKAKVSVANFNEGLQKGWFTSDVLLDTLQKYGAFTDKLSESLDQLGDDMYASKLLGFIDEYKEGTLNLDEAADEAGVSAGKLKEILEVLGSDEYEFGRKAFRAAQEAKTFQEAVDSVKDAVSTGWMDTFEIMFGDYVQAKSLWTGLAENLYTIFAEGGNARNKLLKEAFNKEETINQADWDKLSKAGLANPLFIKAIKNAAKSHSDTAKKIKDDQEWLTYALREGVITAGDFQTAWDKVFNQTKKSNSALADSIKKARESDKEFDALFGTMEKFGASDLEGITWGNHIYDANREAEESVDKVLKKLGLEQSSGEEVVEVLKSMGLFGGIANEEIAHLSDEELRSIGFTEEMITAYKDAIAGGKDALSVRDAILTANMSTGEIWFDTLAQGMDAVVKLFEVAQEEWENIFPPATVDTIRAIVLTLHDAVVHFKDFVETNEALRASFRGLFAAIDIVRMVVTGLGEGAFQVLRALMEGLGLDIGGIVTKISDFVIKAREWLKSSQLIQKGVNLISTIVNLGGKQIRLWFEQFKNIPGLSKHFESFKNGFKNAFQNLPTFIDGLTDRFKEFGKRVGEMDGIRLDNIGDVFTAFKDTVLSYFMEFPGFQALRDAFEQLKEDVKNKLSEMGIDTEDLKKKWEGFKAGAVSIFGAIGNAAVAAFGYIVALYDKISKSEFVQTNLTRFKNAFSDFPEQFSKFIEGLGKKFDEFKAKVKEIGGFSFDNISEIWTAFGDTVGQFFEDFTGFDSIKQAFVDLKDDVKAKLLEMGIDVDGIKEKITGFVDDVKTALENFSLPGVFQSVVDFFIGNKDNLAKGGEKISGTMDTLAEASENLVKKSTELPKWLRNMIRFALGVTAIVAAFKLLSIAKIYLENYLGGIAALNAANAKKIKAQAWLTIALAIGAVAAALYALSKIPVAKLFITIGAVALLAVVLGALAFAMKKLDTNKDMKDVGIGLAAIGAGLLALALVVKVLETVNVRNIPKVALLLAGLVATLVGMSWALKKIDASDNIGVNILAMAASLFVLIGVIKLLDVLTIKNPIKVVLGIIGLLGVLAIMFAETRLAGKNSKHAGRTILGMAGALAIMVGALYALSLLKGTTILKCEAALAGLAAILAGVIFVTKGLKGGAAASILMIGIVLTAMATALGALTLITDTGDLLWTAAGLAAVFLALAAVFIAVGSATQSMKQVIGTIGMMAGVVAAIAAVAGVLYLLQEYVTDMEKFKESAIVMGAALAALLVAVGILGLMGKLTQNVTLAIPALLVVIVAMGLIAVILGLLSNYGGDNLVNSAVGLGAGLIELAAAAAIFGLIGMMTGLVVAGGVTILALMAVLGILGSLDSMMDGALLDSLQSGTEILAEAGKAIGRFIGELIGATIESYASHLPAIGEFFAEFTAIVESIDASALESGMDNVDTLAKVITDVTWATVWQGIGDFFATMNDPERKNAMDQFSENTKKLATALLTFGTYMDRIGDITVPSEEINALSEAIKNLPFDRGGFLSLFTGSNAATPEDVENFKTVGTLLAGALAEFNNALPEGMNVSKVHAASDTLLAISALGQALLGLWQNGIDDLSAHLEKINFSAFAGALNSALSAFSGENGIDGDSLSAASDYIDAVMTAITRLSEIKIDGGDVSSNSKTNRVSDNVSTLAEKLDGLSAYDFSAADTFSESLTKIGEITLDGDLTDKEKVATFKESLIELSKGLKEVGRGQNASSAGKNIVEAGSTVSNYLSSYLSETEGATSDAVDNMLSGLDIEGAIDEKLASVKTSIESSITGDGGIASMLSEEGGLGDVISELKEQISGEGGLADVLNGEDGLTGIVDKVTNSLGGEGGLMSVLGGEEGLGGLTDLLGGEGGLTQVLSDFTEQLGGEDGISSKLDEFIEKISGEGGLQEMLAAFNTETGSTAGLTDAMKSITEIDLDSGDITNIEIVATLKTNLAALVEGINKLSEIDTQGVDKLKSAAETLNSVDLSGVSNKISEAVSAGAEDKASVDAGKSMNEGIAEGMADTSSVTSAVSNLTGAASGEIERASGDFTTKAAALVEAMASGVRQSSAFMDAMAELIQQTVNSIDTNALYNSGVYFVDGFAQGIFNRQAEAIARATALARATMNAVNQTIGAHSPARELIKSGKWFDMGFALGIKRNAYMSEEASEELGARTMDAMQGAINGITDILSSDIDAQPVIRPVFDLSDIRNGAGTISSILDGIGSEPIVSNLNAISDNVAASRTRATSDDILGALTALQGFDRSGDTYNINGVTYDDGSNITDAVRTLVRAVVVGGRA